MNKKILTLLTSSILLLSSCESVLDISPEGRKDLDEIFSSEVTTGAYLNGCYQDFPQFGLGYFFWTSTPEALSDNAWEYHTDPNICIVQAYKDNIKPQRGKNFLIMDIGPSGNFLNISSWDLYYRNINRCNVFLSRIATATVPSEQDRSRWTAEARVLRAFYYMELMMRFGDIPLLTDPTPLEYSNELLKKSSIKTIADFIVSECRDVIENSSELPWRITAPSESERMTKSVAAAVMSRSVLWAASPLCNKGNDYWEEAESVTDYALNKLLSNGFELYTNVLNPSVFGENAYFEYNCTQMDISTSPVDKESILASRQVINNWWDVMGTPICTANKAGLCPTQELVDAFPMNNGKYVVDLAKPYLDENHLKPNLIAGSGYDEKNPYVNRDPRFYALVLYNGSIVRNAADQEVTVETYNGGNSGLQMGTMLRTCTGYYSRKHYHPLSRRNGPAYNASQRIFRLAELYLNYAEAAAECGHLDQAAKAIEPIRKRVNMPNIDISGKSKEQVILEIRNERRIELAYEGLRYYDIRRWNNPNEDMPTVRVETGMWIEKNPDNSYTYQRFRIGDTYDPASGKWAGTGWDKGCYSKKYLFHPLEQEEADRLYALTGEIWQNPGW